MEVDTGTTGSPVSRSVYSTQFEMDCTFCSNPRATALLLFRPNEPTLSSVVGNPKKSHFENEAQETHI
jgi:hypothetical protein